METPRKPAEIRNNKVINSLGQDVTNKFVIGAREALKLASNKCRYAILKNVVLHVAMARYMMVLSLGPL